MTATRAASAADLIAGLSIAGLLLPEAVAYSHLAGLPPQAGVIALFAGLVCYGLIGRSRFAIVSATSSSAAVLASAMLALGVTGAAQRAALAALLVVGAGLAFLLCAALRLGAMSNLIARPVLRGYAFGLALVIAVKQWPAIAGMQTTSAGFFALIAELLRGLPSWQAPTLGCGIAALLGLFVLERVRRVPGALAVIIAGIAAAPWLGAHGVALTGPIDLTPALPQFALPEGNRLPGLAGFSLALMFILYAESYGSIRTYALKHDDAVQPNRDLLALGVANVVAGLLQGTPVGAGYSATSANEAAGAASRFAGLIAAATVLLLVAAFLHWIERIPEPVLAAIVIHAVSKSLRFGVFANYFRWQRDRQVALAAVVAVLLFGVLNGLLAAIAFSLAWLLKSLASPRIAVLGRFGEHDYVDVERFPQAARTPGLLVLRPDEPIFFANAEPLMLRARELVRAAPGTRRVVVSFEESPDLDSTAIETLGELCAWLAGRGIELRVARLRHTVRDALLRAQLPQLSAAVLDYSSVDDAVRGEGVTPAPAQPPAS
jgi:sulfate permease, SulP family